jgi:hypothetical protein
MNKSMRIVIQKDGKFWKFPIQQVAKSVKVPEPAKVPVIGTFTGSGTFTNFCILVVPVPDSQNFSFPVFGTSIIAA